MASRLQRLGLARPFYDNLPWILIAVVAGIAISRMQPAISLLSLAIIILCILSLIDLRVALVVTLTLAPLKTLIETDSTFQYDIGQIALLIMLAIWLARSIAARRRLDLAWTPLYVPIIEFIFAASLSLWVSLSPAGTVTELSKWLEMLILIALALSMARQYGLSWIVAAVIVSAVVQSLIGIYEYYGGSGAPPLWILDFQHFRAFGSFGQPNPFGAFMGLTLPLAIGASAGMGIEMWSVYRQHRAGVVARESVIRYGAACILYGIGAVIIAAGLYVSWSRGAWIGFVAALGMMILFAPRRRIIGIAMIAILGFGLIGSVATGLAPASVVARISDFTQDFTNIGDVRGEVISDANYAVLERLAHWQAAVSMATESPWLGVGFGNYEVAYPRYELMNWHFALGHAHNYYLNLLAETGIIGLLGYVIAWVAIFGYTLLALSRSSGFRRMIALGLLGTWTHLAVHSIFDKLYVNNLYLHLGVMLGLIGSLIVLERNSKRKFA